MQESIPVTYIHHTPSPSPHFMTTTHYVTYRYLSLAGEPEDTEDERQSKNFIQQ